MTQRLVSEELLHNIQDAVIRLKPFVGGLGKAVLREIEIDVVSALEQPAGVDVSGWKLVPVEPTNSMIKAAANAWLDCRSKLLLNKARAAVMAATNTAPQAQEKS